MQAWFLNQALKGTYYMDYNKTVGIEIYSDLLQQIISLLNLSLPEIRQKYTDYSYCLMEYFEKEVEEKSTEIRFDQEEFTMTCTFNKEGKCDFVYFFPDKNETVEEFISYLTINLNYSYIENRWTVSDCYIEVKKSSHLLSDFCLVFYNRISILQQ